MIPPVFTRTTFTISFTQFVYLKRSLKDTRQASLETQNSNWKSSHNPKRISPAKLYARNLNHTCLVYSGGSQLLYDRGGSNCWPQGAKYRRTNVTSPVTSVDGLFTFCAHTTYVHSKSTAKLSSKTCFVYNTKRIKTATSKPWPAEKSTAGRLKSVILSSD